MEEEETNKSVQNEDEVKKVEGKTDKDVKEKGEGSFRGLFIVMMISLLIAVFWDRLSFVGDFLDVILQPTLGWLLGQSLEGGMLIIVFVFILITTLVQKYATDQDTIRGLKEEQKELREEMKKYKEQPQKLMEMQKKQMEIFPKMMKLSMRPVVFTSIPLILFFKWFSDYFNEIGNPVLLGFLSWFWFYLIFALVFNVVLRKAFKVV